MSVSINDTPDYKEFDRKQKEVLQSIIVGDCTCVLGAAGTGKSYTVELAIQRTKYVLCPTGMVSLCARFLVLAFFLTLFTACHSI